MNSNPKPLTDTEIREALLALRMRAKREDADTAENLLRKIHMIVDPGEYGLGSEPESCPELSDKECFRKIGNLIEEYWNRRGAEEEGEAAR